MKRKSGNLDDTHLGSNLLVIRSAILRNNEGLLGIATGRLGVNKHILVSSLVHVNLRIG